MNNLFKVFFYPRKNYVNKNGEVAIRVLLSLDGNRTQFTSELTVPLELWDNDENRALGNSSKTKVINDELEDIEATLKFHFKEMKRYETVINVHQIRDAFLGVTIKSHMLLDVFNEHNEELSKRPW